MEGRAAQGGQGKQREGSGELCPERGKDHELVERHPTTPPLGFRPRRSVPDPSLNFSRPQCQSPAGDPRSPGVPPAERGQAPSRAPRSDGAEGRTAEGRLGKRVGEAKRDPRSPAAAQARGPRAPTRRRGAGAWPRISPPAAAAAAPRPPGPWRLRGCRSGRWSRARGGRAGGKVRRRWEQRGPAVLPGGRLGVSRVPSRGRRVW